MSTVCRAGGLLKSFFPVSARITGKTPLTNGTRFTKNAVIIRACSGSVLQRIEKKKEEAIVGGGQKRIDTQHRKVSLPLFTRFCFFLFLFKEIALRIKTEVGKIFASQIN